MAQGIGIEFEEMGLVVLIGVLLVPGILWIAKAKSPAGMIGRTAVVGGVVAAAVAIEASLDHAVDELVA